MKPEIYEIDAQNKPLGRIASQVAIILRGKNNPNFKPNIVSGNKVKILNVDKIKLTGNKWRQKTYKRYSGYPGGLKTISFKTSFEKDPKKTFRQVVRGMLPSNKLRKEMLKNLVFNNAKDNKDNQNC